MVSQKLASITITMAVIVTIAIVIGQQNNVVAEEKEAYKNANGIAVHTVFNFRQGVEESDGFQVYIQNKGFNSEKESPEFKLEGVLDTDRMILYDAADTAFYRGLNDQTHDYVNFDVDVYLHKEGVTLRQFHYEDCRVTAYKVETLFDKEEGWFGKGFATIDSFTFQCNGYQPINALANLVKTNGYTAEKTMSSNDLTDTSSWSPSFRK